MISLYKAQVLTLPTWFHVSKYSWIYRTLQRFEFTPDQIALLFFFPVLIFFKSLCKLRARILSPITFNTAFWCSDTILTLYVFNIAVYTVSIYQKKNMKLETRIWNTKQISFAILKVPQWHNHTNRELCPGSLSPSSWTTVYMWGTHDPITLFLYYFLMKFCIISSKLFGKLQIYLASNEGKRNNFSHICRML